MTEIFRDNTIGFFDRRVWESTGRVHFPIIRPHVNGIAVTKAGLSDRIARLRIAVKNNEIEYEFFRSGSQLRVQIPGAQEFSNDADYVECARQLRAFLIRPDTFNTATISFTLREGDVTYSWDFKDTYGVEPYVSINPAMGWYKNRRNNPQRSLHEMM